MKLWSKFNLDFTNHGYLHRAVWKALYNFKIKRAQEARHNQLFFQNFQNNEIFEIFKNFKNNSWIKVYYTKSKPLQSLDCLFCFQLEIPFLGKFGPKTQNYQFKLKFCTQTNPNMQISMVMFTFSLFDWKYLFWENLVQKNQNYQSELKFRTRLIWICRIR